MYSPQRREGRREFQSILFSVKKYFLRALRPTPAMRSGRVSGELI
jgi:hypothetical protein